MKDHLLTDLLEKVKTTYQQLHNPLRLNDVFSDKIASYELQNLEPLGSFYQNLAAIYRYKYGETQLGFLWDGQDHSDKYSNDWSSSFYKWTNKLCLQTQFVQAILDLTVFLPLNHNVQLAENRMNAVTLDLFELRIHKVKGIVEMKVA